MAPISFVEVPVMNGYATFLDCRPNNADGKPYLRAARPRRAVNVKLKIWPARAARPGTKGAYALVETPAPRLIARWWVATV
jgi:hypothetical protein